jgi:ABC-2 type transport system ATP-binding protein
VFGHCIDKNLMGAKSSLGSVPQEFNFNTFEPVHEIVVNQGGFYGVSRKTATKLADHYLKELGLWPHRQVESGKLSGGMKRRLMIARALIHRPKLLILDEPTAGVDIELRRSMWQFMDEINHQGTTIILTTHYLEEAESMCRNIAIIDEGLIIENTSMKTLLKSLNSETFVLYLADEILQSPFLQGFGRTSLLDSHTIEVEVPKQRSLNELIHQLDSLKITVNRMRNKVNRLEELFVNITSKKIKAV